MQAVAQALGLPQKGLEAKTKPPIKQQRVSFLTNDRLARVST